MIGASSQGSTRGGQQFEDDYQIVVIEDFGQICAS
jgi:hypothetical protein